MLVMENLSSLRVKCLDSCSDLDIYVGSERVMCEAFCRSWRCGGIQQCDAVLK